MVRWDVDRYEQLQDSAWELELLATAQQRNADRRVGARNSAASRASATELRGHAASLLARYWEPRPPAES